MYPFIKPDDIKSYIDNAKQPLMNGFPFNGDDIQKTVTDSIDQFLPGFMRSSGKPGDGNGQANAQPKAQEQHYDPQVFETHDFVIARILIPTAYDEKQKPRIYMDTYNLFVKGLPNQHGELEVRLPAAIKPKYAKAEYKNGVLEVRMLKRGPEPMTEINVDETS